MHGFTPEHYKEALIFLATAGIVVPLFRRLRISPILGFLAAGSVLGPWGFGAAAHHLGWLSFLALDHVEEIAPIAEFGVVFLLFMLGLELSWERLVLMRKLIFGLGTMQVFGSAAALGAFAMMLKEPINSAAVLGFALSLSSTAIIVPVLADIKRLSAAPGRTIFAVLLFQDLMVAPLLFFVSILGARGGDPGVAILSTLVPALVGLTILVLGGRLVLRPLFQLVASAGSTEFFMAACFLVVIGTGVVTAMAGMSMALGAFIAGLLLAETEYRREIEVTIEPFRGLALGLFFLSVGASLDISKLIATPWRILGIAAVFFAVKFCVTFAAARIMRLNLRTAREAALMLSPGGEFAFVIISAAVASGTLPASVGSDVIIAVTLTMFLIPALGAVVQRLTRLARAGAFEPTTYLETDIGPGAILVGYGRVGQLVGEMLKEHSIPFVAVDTNPALVRQFHAEGVDIHWGNASRPDFLGRSGLGRARALIITMDKPAEVEEIVRAARALHPKLTIVARARDAKHATLLYELGVSDAVPETIEASLQLAEAALADIGVPMGHVIASIHAKRDEFKRLLQPQPGIVRPGHVAMTVLPPPAPPAPDEPAPDEATAAESGPDSRDASGTIRA